jgi:ubiquinone biosynthesis protein UbiJ
MTIIEWYEKTACDPSFTDIATLMQKRGKLSAHCVEMAKAIKDKMIEHRREDFRLTLASKRRKIELLSQTDPNTNKVYTNVKAADLIEVEFSDDLANVAAMETIIEGDKIILKQVNHVLEAMRQDIAELRGIREGK